MKIRAIIVAVLGLCSCASPFTRVDFKYSSATHMNYQEATTTLSMPPRQLVYELSDAFRRKGAVVLERKQLDYYLAEAENGRACWEANASISQMEFEAYRANSFSMYRSIDRTKPFKDRDLKPDCKVLEEIRDTPVESWLLQVEFPPRSAQGTIYTPTVDNFFVYGSGSSVQGFSTSQVPQDVGIQVSTRLYIWASRGSDSKTKVYLEGRPLSGQIEAAPGNGIGYMWWRLADGYQERSVVKSYVLLLEDYERYRSSQ